MTAFAPAVGTPFVADTGTLQVELRLLSATTRDGAGEWLPFNLMFLGPQDPLLPQRTYRLEHPTVGSHDIFLVPVGRDDEGTRYEAVFG